VVRCGMPIRNKKRREVLARFDRTCQYCGVQAEYDAPWLEIDHIIPIALGGGDNDENLQVLCHRCNQAKRDHEVMPLSRMREVILGSEGPKPCAPLYAEITFEIRKD
jgi:5-methylcytosine-specific restriction endonuclease McrA